jgi:hypothetical protein
MNESGFPKGKNRAKEEAMRPQWRGREVTTASTGGCGGSGLAVVFGVEESLTLQ